VVVSGKTYKNRSTQWAIKRSQLLFVCKFILFSLLDSEVNGTHDGMNVTHLT